MTTRQYSMEATVEASRLEEQVFQSNYSISSEMHRFTFRQSDTVMDAGCGTGVLARYLVENMGVQHVDAVDGSDLRIRQAIDLCQGISKTKIAFQQQDLNNIDSKFHSRYDTTICRYVIEHMPDPIHALKQLKATLKKGGRLIVFDLDGVFVNLYSPHLKLQAAMKTIREKVNFDLEIGRKLPSYFHQVGFVDVKWEAELLACQGQRLEEEKVNTEKRFIALAAFLTDMLGSTAKYEEFRDLYLSEMMKPENTLVFTKYICSGYNT